MKMFLIFWGRVMHTIGLTGGGGGWGYGGVLYLFIFVLCFVFFFFQKGRKIQT